MKRYFPLIFIVALLSTACRKKEVQATPEHGSVLLFFEHWTNNDYVLFEQAYYTNAAGNQYRISSLRYFISGLKLYQNGVEKFYSETPPISINGKYAEYCMADYHKIPTGKYDSLSLAFGVVPEYNHHGSFELNYNDYNMYWPENMGGGYHFMKFEGHWKDGHELGTFAFHIGGAENLLTLGFRTTVDIDESIPANLTIAMNTNQWFESPYLYDLTKETGYTMGDTLRMKRLVENGKNAFSIKK